MRAVTLSDIRVAVCVLAATPPGRRENLAAVAVYYAHLADCYRKRTGKWHPTWGNGTLAAALPNAAPGVTPDNRTYAACLAVLAKALVQRHTDVSPQRRTRTSGSSDPVPDV